MLLAKTLLGIKYIVNNHAHLCYFHQERERERERERVCVYVMKPRAIFFAISMSNKLTKEGQYTKLA